MSRSRTSTTGSFGTRTSSHCGSFYSERFLLPHFLSPVVLCLSTCVILRPAGFDALILSWWSCFLHESDGETKTDDSASFQLQTCLFSVPLISAGCQSQQKADEDASSAPPLPQQIFFLCTSSSSAPTLPAQLLFLSTSSSSSAPLPPHLLFLPSSSSIPAPLPLRLLFSS